MKLKNKLIPLAGITAVTAIVTPLSLTSCTKNSVNMVDLTNGYVPTIAPHIQGNLTQHQANKEYFEGISKNGNIFTEDFLYGKWAEYASMMQKVKLNFNGSVILNSLKSGISTPTFGSVEIMYPGEAPVTYPTISTTFKTEADFTVEFFNGSKHFKKTYVISSNVTYKNMPFYVQPDDGYWIAAVPYFSDASWVYNYNTSDWSIDYEYTQTEKTSTLEKETSTSYSFKNKINTPTGMSEMFDYTPDVFSVEAFLQTALTLSYSSFYLTNVNQVPELSALGTMETNTKAVTDTGTSTATLSSVYLGGDTTGVPTSIKTSAVVMTSEMYRNLGSGTIELYADYDEKGQPSGDIVLNQIDVETGDTATTLTISAQSKINTSNIYVDPYDFSDFSGFYGMALPAAKLAASKTYTFDDTAESGTHVEKTYKFALPKYIVAKFTIDSTEYTQTVYLNQESVEVNVTFTKQ